MPDNAAMKSPNGKDAGFFEKNSAVILALIVAAAFVVRFIFIRQLSGSIFDKPVGLDEEYYDNWALSIARGRLIGTSVFYGLPFYPYFLGFIYWIFGHSLQAARFAQICLGTASCFLVYHIGAKAFSRKAGLLSAFMVFLYGMFVFYEGQLVSVALAVFLNLSAVLLLMRAFQDGRKPLFLLSGLVVGCAGLTMSGVLMLVPFVIFGIFYFFGKKAASFLASLIFLAGVMCPVALATLHNYVAEKDLVLITAHGGITFYTGNNPDARPYPTVVKEISGNDIQSFIQGSRDVAERDLKRRLKPSEISSYWTKKAYDFIGKYPARYAGLVFKRFLLLYNAAEIQDMNIDYGRMKAYAPILNATLINFLLIAPFAILGMALGMRIDRRSYLLYSYVVSYSLAVMLFMVNARYRLPLVPVLIVFAGYGIVVLCEKIVRKEKEAAYLAVIVLIAAWCVNLPLSAHRRSADSADYNVIGIAYLEKGEPDKAIEAFLKGIGVYPRNPDLYNSLAQAYFDKRMMDDAESAVKKALEINPDLAAAHNTLGVIYNRRKMPDKALKEFGKAVQLMPGNADFHFNLGRAYSLKERPDLAVAEIKKAIAIFEKPAYYNLLGAEYMRAGEKERAFEAWRRALALDKDFRPAKDALKKYGGETQ